MCATPPLSLRTHPASCRLVLVATPPLRWRPGWRRSTRPSHLVDTTAEEAADIVLVIAASTGEADQLVDQLRSPQLAARKVNRLRRRSSSEALTLGAFVRNTRQR